MTAHPAKFSAEVLARIAGMVGPERPLRVLDPFAGVGGIHRLKMLRTVALEIEPEWVADAAAAYHDSLNVRGNALHLPFRVGTFDGIITSPVYGNRHSDHHNAKDGSRRHSYTHTIGHTLHPDNVGTVHWGEQYQDFHDRAWAEALRVLRPHGFVMINVSNHIRKKKEQPVVEWHLTWFLSHGCKFIELEHVKTRRLREGANYLARVPHEFILHLSYQPEAAA